MSDMTEKLFKKFRKRLEKDAWIKSLLFGFIVGFFALFITAFVFWIVNPNLFWVSFLVWLGVTVLATPIVYFIKYRPTDKDVARAMDDLGLQERMITMLQYESDDSFMATKQREDALNAIAKVNAKSIRFKLSRVMAIVLCCGFVLSSAMATVTVLSDSGLLPDGSAVVDDVIDPDKQVYVHVSYLIDGAGYIEGGEPEQQVLHADSEGDIEEKTTEMVTVVPADGWAFAFWSDGERSPTRYDRNLTEDFEVIAILIEVPKMDGVGDGEMEPMEPGNEEMDMPNTEKPMPGGAEFKEDYYIIDGTKYYRNTDIYKECADAVIKILENEGKLENGEQLPPEIRNMLDAYFKALK
jgi:hypothetical protein